MDTPTTTPTTTAGKEPLCVITVRMGKSLHQRLKDEAHEHRTSLNQYCITKFLQPVQATSPIPEPERATS